MGGGCMKLCFYDDEDPDDPRNAKKKGKGSPAMSGSRPPSFMSGSMGGSMPPLSPRGSFRSFGSPRGSMSRSPPRSPTPNRANTDASMGNGQMPGSMNINIGNGQPNTQMMPYGQMPGQMPGMMPAMMPYGQMPYGMPYHMPYQMQPPPQPQQQQGGGRTILAQNGNFILV